MKNTITQILLVVFLIIFGQQAFSQNNILTDYELEIKKGKQETRDGHSTLAVIVTLTNNSTDTLKYFSMSCSWQEFYSVSTEKLKIQQALCGKNVPVIIEIPPKQSETVTLDLILDPLSDAPEINLRIGFNLMKASASQNRFDYDYEKQKLKGNIIWSNRIIMK